MGRTFERFAINGENGGMCSVHELAAWSQTPPLLPKSSPELITNSISCTPRELSSIGMSEKVWKKESSLKPERISPPSRRITKRSESKPPRVRVKKKVWSDPNRFFTKFSEFINFSS